MEQNADMNLMDAVQTMRSAATYAQRNVEDVTEALYEVGMNKLADRLISAVSHLTPAAKHLSEAFTEDLHAQVGHGEMMMARLINAAIAADAKTTAA